MSFSAEAKVGRSSLMPSGLSVPSWNARIRLSTNSSSKERWSFRHDHGVCRAHS